MPKILLLTFSILFLASCGQKEVYLFEVNADGCRNYPIYFEGFKYKYIGYDNEYPYLSGNYLRMFSHEGNEIFLENTCDFSYTKTPISDN